MIEFDIEGLKALTWFYAVKEGIITPTTWEIIICKSVNGIHIPGDTYMADGMKDQSGLSVKTIKKTFSKGNIQTLSYIQCRCPVKEIFHQNESIIDTLVDKRQESFNKFGLNKMMDIMIIHHRIKDRYFVRLFSEEQPKYENLNYEWGDGIAYPTSNNSKRKRKQWILKRNSGDSTAYQTCLYVKKVFNLKNCIANFSIQCDNEYDISIEEAKQKYAQIQS
jgi:hypothetical protein